MTSVDFTVELPEDETPGELMKGYFTLMRAFGWDLYITSHFALRDDLGSNWFAARISELKQSDPKNWRPNHQFAPQDPGVVLRDYVYEHDSPYHAVFGRRFQMLSAAKKIMGARNTWFHFGDDPSTAQLTEVAKVVRAFVIAAQMKIQGRVDRLVERLDDLSTGRYPAQSPRPSEGAPMVANDPAVEEIATPLDLPRPSIGGTWIGEIPPLRYRLSRAGDVIDPDTMMSVRARVTGDYKEKLRAWTAVEPRGRELWIDTDGAVGGYIGATPRLLGYLGPDPAGDIARGFFVPHFYVVTEGHVVDLDTEERLRHPLAGNVENGSALRVTTYGDVLVMDDEAGVERVATVTPNEWFPGHLGGI